MRIKVLSGGRKGIELPLSDAELNFQMRRIDIEETVPMCRLVEVSEQDNPLHHFEGQTVNMDEVNFFAKRMESLTEYERKVLSAYAEDYGVATMQDLINLTFSMKGLSLLTAYLRSEDILTSVEENLEYLNPPVKNIFQDFVSRIRLINPDLEAALDELRARIADDVFKEWVDALKACLYDRSLKTTLTPIVAKLSDMRIVNAELEYMVMEPRKEFITMVVLVVGNIPLLYFLNKDWYHTLMHTVVGQIMLSIAGIIIFVSTAHVIRLTKPIEYRS